MTEHTTETPLVLVTGAAGLIGTRVVQELSQDHTVVGLDIHTPKEQQGAAAWHQCDLTSDESVEDALKAIHRDFGGKVASVVHLAAYYDFSGEPSPMYSKLTVKGTRRMLQGLKRFDQVEQFVFSSSLLVMRPVEEKGGRLTEESPTHAEWAYPASKLDAEDVIRHEHGDIPAVILRLAGVYDDQCHSLPISQEIRRIYEKQLESYVFPGDADHGQPFIHLDDVASCIRRAIEQRSELEPWETFLIAEPEVMSHRRVQDVLGELIHGTQWPTIRVPKVVAKAGAAVKERLSGTDEFIKPWMIDLADDDYPISIEKARRKLGWEPQRRLRDALPAMIEYLRHDPRGFYRENHLDPPDELAD